MGTVTYLLDSTVIIDYWNGVEGADRFLRDSFPSSAVSAVTLAEVLTGLEESSSTRHRTWLEEFPFLVMERRHAVAAAKLRRRHRWKIPDAFQAALALEEGLKLVTRNTRDFNPREFDFVFAPYAL